MHTLKTFGRYAVLCCSLLLAGCSFFRKELPAQVVAQTGNAILTWENLYSAIPARLDSIDSVMFVQNYIVKWATEELLYDKAKRNILNVAEIDAMVADYRKAITIHHYRQLLTEQRMLPPSDAEVKDFYEEHKDEFLLEDPLLKGVLVAVPNGMPKIKNLIAAMRKLDDDAIQYIDKYCMRYAVEYDFFMDNWVTYSELQKRLPLPSEGKNAYLKRHKFNMWQDSTYRYLFTMTDYRLIGDNEPFEFVKENVRRTINNQKKMVFMAQFAEDLYNDAIRTGEVKIFIEQPRKNENDTLK
ncbi:MAG: peptidyl-prolyl cis-trans isomerase [Prevotellaceae bacterium]|jgi:hypothetical protein|nr:peptidyl-prolyl cis-trans isomerase [Prevotellaceae bacterium]